MNNNIPNVGCKPITIGELPTSYFESLSYYEQICLLCNKMNEIIDFMNNNISAEIKAYIDKEFNNILLDTMYNEETETLIMYINKENNL